MLRERVSEDIYVFTSEVYAQVTAGVVIYPDGAVVIDTLAFPFETKEIKDFVEKRLNAKVRFLIYTHYHADHTNGAYLFPDAQVIAHKIARDRLDSVGRQGLARAKEQSPELAAAEVVLPSLLLEEGRLNLHLAKKTLQLFHTPGHSPDSISVLLKEDRILFAGDMMMPLPHFVDGDPDELARSLATIPGMALENVVQGHGELVLRGEIDDAVRSNLKYLDNVRRKVEAVVKRGRGRDTVRDIDIESCGKSRIPLNGLVTQLHIANMLALYDRLAKTDRPAKTERPAKIDHSPKPDRPAKADRSPKPDHSPKPDRPAKPTKG